MKEYTTTQEDLKVNVYTIKGDVYKMNYRTLDRQ